jgi:hypothetical protein
MGALLVSVVYTTKEEVPDVHWTEKFELSMWDIPKVAGELDTWERHPMDKVIKMAQGKKCILIVNVASNCGSTDENYR